MDGTALRRMNLALAGGIAGLCLWLIHRGGTLAPFPDRAFMMLSVLVTVFFGATLAMTGPMRLRRAIRNALPPAAGVAALMGLASLRHEGVAGFQAILLHPFAAFVLTAIVLPFMVAAETTGWRDYDRLFTASWQMVTRWVAAWVFVGLVWGLLWLAESLLALVGLGFMDLLMQQGGPMAAILTGVALGIGLAAAWDHAEVLAPGLVLGLLRLLSVPVLVVAALFLVALPVQGLSQLPGGVSATVTLMVLVALAVTLVAVMAGHESASEDVGRINLLSARLLALLMPFLAALGAWALWQRVAGHGWTPDRLFVACIVLAGAGYALAYAVAAALPGDWRARVRRVNVPMALVMAGMAGLWLTPVLNAEAISARSQLARIEAGGTNEGDIDLAALSAWGRPGQAAMARLAELAEAPGREALAAHLAAWATPGAGGRNGLVMTVDIQALLMRLKEAMPVQPPGATATRDMLLSAIPAEELEGWIDACEAGLPGGDRPGCVFVVADFWPAEPGEEAIILLREPAGFVRYEGLGMASGEVQRRSVGVMEGLLPDRAAGEALIAALQDAPPALRPAPLNQLSVAGGLLLLP